MIKASARLLSGRTNYLLYLVIFGAATGLSFVKPIFFAKKLSVADFGFYSLVMTSYAFSIYLGSFGASEYMLKLGAREFSSGLSKNVFVLRTNALVYGVLTTSLISAITVFLGFLFDESLFEVLLCSAMIAIPAIGYNVFDAYYRSTQKFLWFSTMLFVKSAIVLIFGVLAIDHYGLRAAIGSEVVGFVLVFLVIFILNIGSTSLSHLNGLLDEIRSMITHGMSTILVNMTRNVSYIFERYFLSFAMGLALLGKYSFVMILFQISVVSGGIVTNIWGPKWLSSYAINSDRKQLLKSVLKGAGLVAGLEVAFYPVFYFTFPWFLSRFFENYSSLEVVQMGHVIYVSSIVYLFVSFLDWFFISISKERTNLVISIFSLIFLCVCFFVCHYLNLGVLYYSISFLMAKVVALVMILNVALRETR